MNILIVEDEKTLAEEIAGFLKKEGFQCKITNTFRQASEEIFVNTYDFVLLDLGLPDKDGLELLKEAREDNNKETAFIIITARGGIDDRIKGLDSGADDYLSKPFSLMELQSRIHAINRRKHGLQKNTIQVKDFIIDVQSRTVYCNNTEVLLTKKEFDLLNYLVLHKNKVLTRLQLTEHIWGELLEDDYASNYIDVHIKNLRKKLAVYGDAEWLNTVRGIGYKVTI